MQGVYKDRSAHVALVFNAGLRWVSYAAFTPVGPRVFKARIDEFEKEFRVLPGYEFRDAALKFLNTAKQAYEYDAEIINVLMEIVMAKQVNEMSMTELAAAYNDLAKVVGAKPRKSFKSKSEGVKAIEELDKKAKEMSPAQKEVASKKEEKAAKAKSAKPEGEKKARGSGIGAFCLDLIAKGKSNGEILEAVQKKFPDAKTSKGCIAFYRNKAKQ